MEPLQNVNDKFNDDTCDDHLLTSMEKNNENFSLAEKEYKKQIKVSPRAKLLDHKQKNWSWYNKFNNRSKKSS